VWSVGSSPLCDAHFHFRLLNQNSCRSIHASLRVAITKLLLQLTLYADLSSLYFAWTILPLDQHHFTLPSISSNLTHTSKYHRNFHHRALPSRDPGSPRQTSGKTMPPKAKPQAQLYKVWCHESGCAHVNFYYTLKDNIGEGPCPEGKTVQWYALDTMFCRP
jgi:hypothetical protein